MVQRQRSCLLNAGQDPSLSIWCAHSGRCSEQWRGGIHVQSLQHRWLSHHAHSSWSERWAIKVAEGENGLLWTGDCQVLLVNWFLVPPSIRGSEFLEEIRVLQSSPVTLTCDYSGDPQPEIVWAKNGNPISLSDPHYYINMNGSLEIFTADQADTAQYTCTAKNPVGDDTKTISLVVRGKNHTFNIKLMRSA